MPRDTATAASPGQAGDAKRRTKKIDADDVKAALRDVGKMKAYWGRAATTPPYEIGDTVVPGLALRVRARSAVWTLRGRSRKEGKQSTWRVADAAILDNPSDARKRAKDAKGRLERGATSEEVSAFLRELENGGPVERHFDPERDGWDWETARDEFLAEIKAKRHDATWNDYRKTLHSKDVECFSGRLVKKITEAEVQAVRDTIDARGAHAQAAHLLRILKRFFKWVARDARSGVPASPAAGVAAPMVSSRDDGGDIDVDPDTGTIGKVPSPEELGALPWRLAGMRLNPAARLAAVMVLATVQRRSDVAAMRWHRIKLVGGQPVWFLRPKSNRWHALPLPPLAQAVLRAARALASDGCPWVFPQQRLWRGDDAGDGHLADHSIWRAMQDAGFGHGPHALRAAFATIGENRLGNSRVASKAVLDHMLDAKVLAVFDVLSSPDLVTKAAEGQSGDVTARHYAHHLGLRFKRHVLGGWDSFLLGEIARQSPDGRALPGFLGG